MHYYYIIHTCNILYVSIEFMRKNYGLHTRKYFVGSYRENVGAPYMEMRENAMEVLENFLKVFIEIFENVIAINTK